MMTVVMQHSHKMKRIAQRAIQLLLLLPGLAAVAYVLAILFLYYLTSARHFDRSDDQLLSFYYGWIRLIDTLINVYLIGLMTWLPCCWYCC